MTDVKKKKDTPSPDQDRAIHLNGTSLLVSAAAGSGKTFTLVERIVGSILNGRYNVDELLVVTFTNAAASEMKERVEKKLLEASKANRELLQQLVRLPNASISTLHSFCQSLIRQNFTQLDLDPKFRLGGEQEIGLMKESVIEELFEKKYAEGDTDFLAFVQQYGTDHDDTELYEMILRLYEFSRSQPEPAGWLDGLAERFDISDGAALKKTPWFEEIYGDIRRVLRGAADKAEYLARRSVENGCEPYKETLEEDKERTEKLIEMLENGTWDELKAGINVSFPRIKTIKGGDDSAKKEIQDGRKEIKAAYNKLKEFYFFASEGEILEDLRTIRPFAVTLCRIVKDFDKAFQRAKKKKSMLDFNDLEHYALQLLLEKDAETGRFTGRVTETAQKLREKYKEVMVDEYQDTNGVQEAILQCIQNGNNIFAVGDVKQSIYRFRLADPMLFLKKQEDALKHPKEMQALFLKENYRSRSEVLGVVNFLFSQFMIKPEMELDYDADAALYAKADYGSPVEDSFEEEPAELILVNMDDKGEDEEESLAGLELEAQVIAKRLLELKKENRQVFDKEAKQYRPICWRDMAVLMRSVSGKAQTVVEALRSQGVPAYASLDAGYFEEVEVRLMLSLLAVIDNAHQDVPLAAVLHSPIVGMNAEELAELRADNPDGDLFDALAASSNIKAVKFRERLASWRRKSRRVGVPELLHTLYLDTGYYDYVGAQPGGMLRQANLRMLSDRAFDYEKTSFRGLFRFLQFIRNMQKRKTDLSSARTLGENEDVVRVMSVHMSKGLEFPVVVIADIGKKFNTMDTSAKLLMHRELGIGPYCTHIDGSLKWRYPTLARQAVSTRITRECKAEEMRILYVAMTRAREKLIMTGNVGGLHKKTQKWCRVLQNSTAAIPGYIVMEANSWLDWIAPAVMRDDECGEPLRVFADYEGGLSQFDYDRVSLGDFNMSVSICPAAADKVVEQEHSVPEWEDNIKKQRPLPETDSGKTKKTILDWAYPFATDTPSKFTVTEIKERVQAIQQDAQDELPLLPGIEKKQEDMAFPMPKFMCEPSEKDAGALKGAAYGTLMHRVLEKIKDYPQGRNEIEKSVDALVESGILTEEERRAVNISALSSFYESEIGQRMRGAKAVYREQSFSMLVDASRFGYKNSKESENMIFLQGVVDLFFEEDDGSIVLVDYKTDRNTTPDSIRDRYKVQLALYREAVERSTNKKVKECCIYRLFDHDVVKVETDIPVHVNSL